MNTHDVIRVTGARDNNLKNVSVEIPKRKLTVFTGVSGSGKSSLLACLPRELEDRVLVVDQTPIKGSRRSNPATYTGALDSIRKAFAKANADAGATPALFSANSEGACPNCNGAGVVYVELGFMSGVDVPCEVCAGLVTVGLGYITLGQPLTTLSGGERQRLKLAVHLGNKKAAADILILDEPTTGLHLADVEMILGVLDHLVDEGHTVIAVEHHLAVVAHADHAIDLGPGAGSAGGEVVASASPAELVDSGTVTGRYLASYVGS